MNSKLNNYAYDLCYKYAEYNRHDDCFDLYVDKLPDDVKSEFVAILMSEDPMFAGEATSIDNPNYESFMLPSMIVYLKDPTNEDKRNDYIITWNKGLLRYSEKKMQDLIYDAIGDYAYTQRSLYDEVV